MCVSLNSRLENNKERRQQLDESEAAKSYLEGSKHPLSTCDDSGRGTTRTEDAQGTPTQSHISPSKLVYED